MCTCIDLKTKDYYFGRNLDLDERFGEKVVITPRNYKFDWKNGSTIFTKYAMIGMASVVQNYPLYAEAANERGLAMAGLYFPQNAYFFEPKDSNLNLAPYELIPYFLGQYATVAEIKNNIKNLNITNIPFSKGLPIADLHWMISDGENCIVLEQMKDGLKIYDNPVGVLTNNPPFDYHLMNLNNYMNLTPNNKEKGFSNKINLQAYGQGMGAIGLPGDASPASRFIRAAFYKLNSRYNSNPDDIVALIGPSICKKCFETSKDIALMLSASVSDNGVCADYIEGKYYADLKEINKRQMIDLGIKNIDTAQYCTCCNNDKFFSYRKENKTTNRISAFLTLN